MFWLWLFILIVLWFTGFMFGIGGRAIHLIWLGVGLVIVAQVIRERRRRNR